MPEAIFERAPLCQRNPGAGAMATSLSLAFADKLVAVANVHAGMNVLILSTPGHAGVMVSAVTGCNVPVAVLSGPGPVLRASQHEQHYDRVLMVGDITPDLVIHGLRFLKPCCGLVALMDGDIETSSTALAKTFRSMVERRGGWFLPQQSDQPAGTVVVRIPSQER